MSTLILVGAWAGSGLVGARGIVHWWEAEWGKGSARRDLPGLLRVAAVFGPAALIAGFIMWTFESDRTPPL